MGAEIGEKLRFICRRERLTYLEGIGVKRLEQRRKEYLKRNNS